MIMVIFRLVWFGDKFLLLQQHKRGDFDAEVFKNPHSNTCFLKPSLDYFGLSTDHTENTRDSLNLNYSQRDTRIIL